MKKVIFITGTDTNVGKTHITRALLKHYQAKGMRVLAVKPIASGCDWVDGQIINADARYLVNESSLSLAYEIINPFAFLPPIAPHLAASLVDLSLSSQLLSNYFNEIKKINADIYLIEGAGGWALPLNTHETLADVVIQHQMDIILVVGMRLGCLNHALLTAESIKHRGGKLIGWIANTIDPNMLSLNENIETLTAMLKAPLLQRVGFGENHLSEDFSIEASPDANDRID